MKIIRTSAQGDSVKMVGRLFVTLAVVLCSAASGYAQQIYAIDSEKSVLRVELGTAGLFGFLGDRHLIEGRIAGGTITYFADDLSKSSIQLRIEASSLKVLDPNLSGEDRDKVQQTMQSDRVLNIAGFPEISFESRSVSERKGELMVTGELHIRDVKRQVLVRCTMDRDSSGLKARAVSRFKQKDFGIKPVSAGLGAVKVKNEIIVKFEVFGRLVNGGSGQPH